MIKIPEKDEKIIVKILKAARIKKFSEGAKKGKAAGKKKK